MQSSEFHLMMASSVSEAQHTSETKSHIYITSKWLKWKTGFANHYKGSVFY